MKTPYNPPEYQRLRTAAQRRANTLRDQAFGDFGSRLGQMVLRLMAAIRHPLRRADPRRTAGEAPCRC